MEGTLYKIVEIMYKEEKFNQLLSSFVLNDNWEINNYLKEELIQEISLILLDYKNKENLIKLWTNNNKDGNNKLECFILKIIKNQIGSGGKFHKYMVDYYRKINYLNVENY